MLLHFSFRGGFQIFSDSLFCLFVDPCLWIQLADSDYREKAMKYSDARKGCWWFTDKGLICCWGTSSPQSLQCLLNPESHCHCYLLLIPIRNWPSSAKGIALANHPVMVPGASSGQLLSPYRPPVLQKFSLAPILNKVPSRLISL